jgi:hypothetical protein
VERVAPARLPSRKARPRTVRKTPEQSAARRQVPRKRDHHEDRCVSQRSLPSTFLPRSARDAPACPHAGKSICCLKIKHHLMAGRRPGHPEQLAQEESWMRGYRKSALADLRKSRKTMSGRPDIVPAHEGEKGINPDAQIKSTHDEMRCRRDKQPRRPLRSSSAALRFSLPTYSRRRGRRDLRTSSRRRLSRGSR